MIFILSSIGVESVYNFLPVSVTPFLTTISIIASGAIDSVVKGSVALLNAVEIPSINPGNSCSSFSIPSWTDLNIVLKGCSK